MHVGCVCCRAIIIIIIILPLLFSLDNEMLQNYLACILQVQHLTEFIELKLIARLMNSFNSQSWVKYMKMLLRALLIHVFC